MAEMERTIGDFMRIHHQALESELPPIAGPRALLKTRLAELAGHSPATRWRRSRLQSSFLDYAFGLVLIVVMLLGTRMLYRSGHGSGDVGTHVESLPNPSLTPGFTRSVALADLCVRNHDEVVRDVPSDLRQRVFREYGMSGASDTDYEVDYLITPGLGGADDIRNLWPEPHYDTPWNSYVKDQLEDRLHQMVCSGKVSLTTAQREIAHDWISAYKKYFHTDGPNRLTSSAPNVFSAYINWPANESVGGNVAAICFSAPVGPVTWADPERREFLIGKLTVAVCDEEKPLGSDRRSNAAQRELCIL
jgi:hypothetical protein